MPFLPVVHRGPNIYKGGDNMSMETGYDPDEFELTPEELEAIELAMSDDIDPELLNPIWG
jgi:hypothetical protein